MAVVRKLMKTRIVPFIKVALVYLEISSDNRRMNDRVQSSCNKLMRKAGELEQKQSFFAVQSTHDISFL